MISACFFVAIFGFERFGVCRLPDFNSGKRDFRMASCCIGVEWILFEFGVFAGRFAVMLTALDGLFGML